MVNELECNLQFKNLLSKINQFFFGLIFSVIFRQLSHPLTSQLHIEIRLVWFIVLIGKVAAAHRNGWLYLSSLMPLVEACDGDDLCWSTDGRLPGRLVVETFPPGVSILAVPGSDPGINISGSNTGYEHQRVFVGKTCQRFPIFPAGAIGETISGEVGVESIKARWLDVCPVFQLHYEADKESIQLCRPYW